MASLGHPPSPRPLTFCAIGMAALLVLAAGCAGTTSDDGSDGGGGTPGDGSGGGNATGGHVGSGGVPASGGTASGGSGGHENEGGYAGGGSLPDTCEDGETLPAPDGCNVCTCLNGGWACTLIGCVDPDVVGCGGWLGDTCAGDEYCAYEEGQLCGAADASSVCQTRPDGCTLDYDPVCGCDGETYSNACAAASAGTGVYGSGACEGQTP